MTPLEVNRLFHKMGCDDIYKKVMLYSKLYKTIEQDFPNEGYAKCTIVGMVADYVNVPISMHVHLSFVITAYPLSFYEDINNVRSIIDGYKEFLVKLKQLSIAETGVPLYGF